MVRVDELPYSEGGPDLDAIEYIEEEEDDFNLGFDTSDYLPDTLTPIHFIWTLGAIEYIKDNTLDFDTAACLPANFNLHAYPEYFMDISYMDPSEDLEPEGDHRKHLPEGFDP